MENEFIIPAEVKNFMLRQIGAVDNEKLIIKGFASEGFHHTLHFGIKSKVLDFHLTDEKYPEGHPKRNTTLFLISHYSIAKFFVHIRKPFLVGFRKYMMNHTVNLKKLCRSRCILMPIDIDEKYAEHFVNYNMCKKKFRFTEKINVEIFDEIFLFPEEMSYHQSSGYFVYTFKKNGKLKKMGLLYRDPKRPNGKRHTYISNANHARFMTVTDVCIFSGLRRVNFFNKKEMMPKIQKHFAHKYAGNSLLNEVFPSLKILPVKTVA